MRIPFIAPELQGGRWEGRVAGRETVGAKPVIVLQYTPAAGPGVKLYLDAGTYLVSRSVVKLNVPEAGGRNRAGDGCDRLPRHRRRADAVLVTVSGSGQMLTITLAKVEYNVALDDAVFSRPGAK